jgi:hypothetical protein
MQGDKEIKKQIKKYKHLTPCNCVKQKNAQIKKQNKNGKRARGKGRDEMN